MPTIQIDRHLRCSLILTSLILTSVAAPATADLDKDVDACGETYRGCVQTCNRNESTYVNKKGVCDERKEAESTRHKKALADCTGSWNGYRRTIKENHDSQSRACSDAACRERALGGYNLLYNSSWIGQHTCEQAEGAIHEDNLDKIDGDCADYERSPRQVGRECREECTVDRNDCIQDAKQSNGADGAGMRLDPCPPGTDPNPLGQCVRIFKDSGSGTVGADGCPPGSVRGPRDNCVPKLRIAAFVPSGGDWYLYCPKGTKPSPIDGGCVVDPGNGGSHDPDVTGRDCPPGTAPGADDRCAPVLPSIDPGLGTVTPTLRPTLVIDPSLSPALEPAVDLGGLRLMKVDDPVRALEVTRRALETP